MALRGQGDTHGQRDQVVDGDGRPHLTASDGTVEQRSASLFQRGRTAVLVHQARGGTVVDQHRRQPARPHYATDLGIPLTSYATWTRQNLPT